MATKQIETLSDLMKVVQDDMQELRAGSLDLAKGRLLSTFHKLLLKGAELNLTYMRMERGKRPEKELRIIGALPEASEPELTNTTGTAPATPKVQ